MGTLRLRYEEKNILRPIGAFFLLKLKSDQNPHTKWPTFKSFSAVPTIADHAVKAFLDARGPM